MERPPAGEIPDQPGVYLFKDARGRVIYVGKARSLRKRIATYFGSDKAMATRTQMMLDEADALDWMLASGEAEAILLEYNLIKEHSPRFNIKLRDDKSFPFLAVTSKDRWPRPTVMRGKPKKGIKYYGPYAHAHAIRETLDLLLRTFPLRTCSDSKLKSHEMLGRPCLYYHIDRCSGPCVGKIDENAYSRLVADFCAFLDGDYGPVIRRLEKEMAEASDSLEFERAARKRDELAAVHRVIDRQRVLSAKSETFDAIAVAEDELEASVQVFSVVDGRLVGRRGFVVDKVEAVSRPQLMSRVIEELYAGALDQAEGGRLPGSVPPELLVDSEPEDIGACEEFLSSLRGGRVKVRVPKRGEKLAFLETVRRNAEESFTRHRMRRSADHNARSRSLLALQEALGLPEAPLRIECFDISNTGPTEVVGSMVVLEDALPKPRDYRRFKIRNEGQDDFAAMAEVVRRRLEAYLRERDAPDPASAPDPDQNSPTNDRRPKKFAYPPNLLLVDGGLGQLNAALGVLEDLGLEGEIPVAGLAKRFEEVYLPGRPDPLILDRRSEALYLLQRARDEAHRFALDYHRKLRETRSRRSVLDDIPGLGHARKKLLLREFGSIKKLKEAGLGDISKVRGIPAKVAELVYVALHEGEKADR